jgi:hypothetical protein
MLAVPEGTPRAHVEPPPRPELDGRREREQQQVEPPLGDRNHHPEHHGQTPDQDQHRERRRDEELPPQPPVLALAHVLDGPLFPPHHAVTGPLHGPGQSLRPYLRRVVLDRRPLHRKVDVGPSDPLGPRERLLDPPRASRATHANDRERYFS